MSEKSNPPGGEAAESQSSGSESTPAEEYKVGPGRPPRDTRWKKGGKSPNPRGRPRKDRSLLPDLKKIFEQALKKKIPVSGGGRKALMTRIAIGVEQQLNQFAKGDRHALRPLMEIADRLDIDFLAPHKQAVEEALASNHQAILDAYVGRRTSAGEVAPAERASAPSELLDDDAEEGEAEAMVASPPTAVTEPQPEPEIPEPTPVPGTKYPKPFSQMAWSEIRAWYPEWWAKYGEAWEKQRAKKQQAAARLDQASLGRGRPPPGGVSVTTGKPT